MNGQKAASLRCWLFTGLLGLALLIPPTSRALITVNTVDVPGPLAGIEVVEGLAYVARQGSGFRIIDVSNPSVPVDVGGLDTPGYAEQIAIHGGLAYVADGASGLRVIDVSNPSAPFEIGAIDTPGRARDVEIAEGLAYVADGDSGLRVIDVSNPATPVEIGAIDTPGHALDVEIAEGLAYVADGDSGLRVIDVSSPATPVEIASIDTPGFAGDVEIAEGLAYVADHDSGLRVIDVSDASAPVEISAIELRDAAYRVAVLDGVAYVTQDTAGMQAIDVSNPSTPSLLGSISPVYSRGGITASDGFAYVANRIGILQVIDLSNPAYPAEILSAWNEIPSFSLQGVTLADGIAYMHGGPHLPAVDVSDPSAPTLIGWGWGAIPYDVAIQDGLAYVTDAWDSGLKIYDVTDPHIGGFIGGFLGEIWGTGGRKTAVDGAYAYGVGRYPFTGMTVIDVSDPTAPTAMGNFATQEYPYDIAVANGIAYLPDVDQIHIVDVSDPAAPIEIGSIPGSGYVALVGDFLYANNPLRVIDVSDPRNPVVLGAAKPTGYGSADLAVAYGVAYVPSYGAGVDVYDVSDPSKPMRIGGYGLLDSTFFAEVADGLVYLVAEKFYGSRSMYIVDFGPEYARPIDIDVAIKPGTTPNSINPSLEGGLPVAILGSDGLDVAYINLATLVFGPEDAPFSHSHGPHFEDVDGDGVTDLTAHFLIEEAGIAFGDTEACVTGKMADGGRLRGCDAIRTVPDMDGDSLLDVEEASYGTDPLNPDTDGDGLTDGREVLVMGTDPLDARDPAPARDRGPRKHGKRRR
jgi:hypothetical protein